MNGVKCFSVRLKYAQSARLVVLVSFLCVLVVCVTSAPAQRRRHPYQKYNVGRKNVEEMANMFEGDMILSDAQEKEVNTAMQERGGLAGIVGDKYRWDEKIIHYEVADDYYSDEKEVIEGAMEEIGQKTCIKFVERDDQEDYIKVEDGTGCSSKVGKRGGEQTVTLSRNGCLKHGVAIHELVHAIGFWHEQSRTDRDDYVDIIWSNIEPGKNINFSKYLKGEINENKVPYDYNSVMHYRADAFQHEDTDEDTIVPKDPNVEIGQRIELSELDALKINLMYCPELVKNGTYVPLPSTPVDKTSTNKEDEEGDDETDTQEDSDSNSTQEDDDEQNSERMYFDFLK